MAAISPASVSWTRVRSCSRTRAGASPADPAARARQLDLRTNEPFQLYLLPQGRKAAGKYEYRIVVSGPGAAETSAPLTVSVDPPLLKVREPVAAVYAEPGSTAAGRFELGVVGIGDELESICCVPEGGGTSLLLEPADPAAKVPSLRASLETHAMQNPLPVRWMKTGDDKAWSVLPFRILVPKDAAFGEYHGKAILAGKQVASCEVRFKVLVNALLVEQLAATEEGSSILWRPADKVLLLQFLHHDMSKTLRVRTGMGDPLSLDQIDVVPLKAFADESGDAMRLPQADKRLEDGGRAVLVTLRFPKTSNAHEALAYGLKVRVESPALKLKPRQVDFRVRFWDHQNFLAPEAK